MRVRKMKLPPSNTNVYTLDGGDWIFGHGSQDYFIDVPDAVAQICLTRLALNRGEWFLDTREGTPYMQDILGHNTNYDFEIQARILGTPGVTELINYSSNIDSTRNLTVNAQIQTVYGQVTIMFPQ